MRIQSERSFWSLQSDNVISLYGRCRFCTQLNVYKTRSSSWWYNSSFIRMSFKRISCWQYSWMSNSWIWNSFVWNCYVYIESLWWWIRINLLIKIFLIIRKRRLFCWICCRCSYASFLCYSQYDAKRRRLYKLNCFKSGN